MAGNELDLQAEVHELRAAVARLEAEVRTLRDRPAAAVDRAEPRSPDRSIVAEAREVAGHPFARRELLRKAGVAVAATGAAGLALDVAGADPASAATLVGSGNPGVRGDGLGGDGVQGNTNTSGSSGVYANTSTAGAIALTARNFANGTAVEAFTGGSGRGVLAHATDGYAVEAQATGGVGVVASGRIGVYTTGSQAAVAIAQTMAVPGTSTAWHSAGELCRDTNGSLWYTVAAGAPPVWRKLAGTGTAGALHVLTSTNRIYDSRPGFAPLLVTKGVLANGAERLVDCHLYIDPDATAVVVNLTVTETSPAGWLSMFKGDIAWPDTSSINWGASGTTIANGAIVPVDAAGRFKVKCAPGASTHFLVDLVGFCR
jgi:hypothetical protein